ncbi:MAG: hypothetical protein WA485_11425 [Candidatus Sulfotelmatobacter sp.]
MSSIPLPALDIKPTQPNDALGSYTKMVSLGSLLQQQKLQGQQIQAGEQENQMRALQLQDQQTLRQSAKGLDWSQPDTFQKWITNAQQNGVSPQTLSQLALQRAQYNEQIAKTDTATLASQKEVNNQLQGHIDAIKGITDPVKRAQAAQTQGNQIVQSGIARTPQAQQMAQALASGKWVPNDDDLTMFENGLTDHNTQIDQRLKQAETAKNATDAALNQNKVDIINSWKQNPQQVLSQVDSIVPPNGPNAALNARTKSQVQFALGNGDVDGAKAAIKQAAEQVGAVEKDVQVAKATQPLKLEQSRAEAQARMALEGMAKPVYAFDPQTNQKDLMSQTEAIAQGRKVMTPVTGKEVSEDTQLINRLGDVHQKIAEYENALQKPISAKDQGNLAALLGTDKTKVNLHPGGELLGGIGIDIPMDRLDAALNKENLAGLSANARDQLVAYRNAREALTGYTRVLSGSSKSSDKNLELQEQTLPDPSITDPDFSTRAIGAFKQNLRVVGQGLPNIPGVKTPQEWENEVTQPQQSAPSRTTPGNTTSLLSILEGR